MAARRLELMQSRRDLACRTDGNLNCGTPLTEEPKSWAPVFLCVFGVGGFLLMFHGLRLRAAWKLQVCVGQ